jgi:hypothetical protein
MIPNYLLLYKLRTHKKYAISDIRKPPDRFREPQFGNH